MRRFVSEFYARIIEDADASGRLALATHELLENAAKYATGGETALYVELDRKAGAISVRTRNQTNPQHISVLTPKLRRDRKDAETQTSTTTPSCAAPRCRRPDRDSAWRAFAPKEK